MRPNGGLVGTLGWLFGTGPGAGMSLILVSAGLLFGVACPLLGFAIPALRNADCNQTVSETDVVVAQQELAQFVAVPCRGRTNRGILKA